MRPTLRLFATMSSKPPGSEVAQVPAFLELSNTENDVGTRVATGRLHIGPEVWILGRLADQGRASCTKLRLHRPRRSVPAVRIRERDVRVGFEVTVEADTQRSPIETHGLMVSLRTRDNGPERARLPTDSQGRFSREGRYRGTGSRQSVLGRVTRALSRVEVAHKPLGAGSRC